MTLLFPVALLILAVLQIEGYHYVRGFIDLVVTTQREVDDTLSHQSQIYTHVTSPGPQDPWWHGYASRPARKQLV